MSTSVLCVVLAILEASTCRAQQIRQGDSPAWYKADLHTHYSFRSPIEDEIKKYRETGYQFLVLSTKDDVKYIKYASYSTPEMLVVEGVEQAFIARTGKLGHVLGFPVSKPYPLTTSWKLTEGYSKLRVKNKNVILGINHPHDKRWLLEDVMDADAAGVHIFELNSSDMKHGEFETALWDAALSSGAVMYAMLTNDVHAIEDIDAYGYIMIRAESLDAGKIMDALRTGDFYAEESGCKAKPARYELVRGDATELQVSAPGAAMIRIIGEKGALLSEVNGENAGYGPVSGTKYIRAEIIDPNGRMIFMQPFFLK